jgi:hypothetical protein
LCSGVAKQWWEGHYTAATQIEGQGGHFGNDHEFHSVWHTIPMATTNRPSFVAIPQNREALVRFCSILSSLTKDGKVKAPPLKEFNGGVGRIVQGLDDIRAGNISGKKVVISFSKE